MRGREYLAMRVHVKCTGPTKKYGSGIFYITTKRVAYESSQHGLCFERPHGLLPGEDWEECQRISGESGVFAIRNRIGLQDFQIKGKHDFVLVWYENNDRFTFNATIQKHDGKKPMVQDLLERWFDVSFCAERHYYNGWREYEKKGDNVRTLNGRKTVCTVIQPDKIPKHISTAPLYNIVIPDLGDRVNSGEWTFKDASAQIPEQLCHNIDIMSGETFEDQYQFEKAWRWIDAQMGENYDFEYGMMRRNDVLLRFKNGMKALLDMQKWYNDAMVDARKTIQEYDSDMLEKEWNCDDCKKEWIEENNIKGIRKWLTLESCYKGPMREYAKLLRKKYDVLTRTIEIVEKKYKEFEFASEFEKYARCVFYALWDANENGGDITETPKIGRGEYLNLSPFATDNRVKEYRKRLTERL